MGERRRPIRSLVAALLSLTVLAFAGCGDEDGRAGGGESRTGGDGDDGSGEMTVAYEKPRGETQELVAEFLRESELVESVAESLTDTFVLPEDVTVTVARGNDGPAYDPNAREIIFNYSFVEFVADVFAEVDPEAGDEEILEATANVSAMVLLHEVGHAFVDLMDIPITGREEDSVDNLATVITAEFVDGGGDWALDYADFFSLIADEPSQLREVDFWDEHSLDLQRAFQTVCLVYGSDPDAYDGLLDFIPPDRADLCLEEWEQISEAWLVLLEPHVAE